MYVYCIPAFSSKKHFACLYFLASYRQIRKKILTFIFCIDLGLSWGTIDSVLMKKSAGLYLSGHLKPWLSKKAWALSWSPMYASLPSVRKQTLSNISKISLDGWWMVQMIVLPFLARSFMLSTIDMAIKESRPLVGSSQNRIEGLVRISEANDRRRISPPDMPLESLSGLPIK